MIAIGGSDPVTELAALSDMSGGAQPISVTEYQQRRQKAQDLMAKAGLEALFLTSGTNLYYFTGLSWRASERLAGAILTRTGELRYIAPFFEIRTFEEFMLEPAPVSGWQEHEDPCQLVGKILAEFGIEGGQIGIDEATPFFISDGLRQACPNYQLVSAKSVTAGCRMQKSATEIALIQQAMDMTMAVHRAAAKILKPGIATTEVVDFIDQAHRKVGAAKGSYFCIVLFGEATAYPHGVKDPQILKQDDMVLIDTGCELFSYKSDITRSYVYGQASEKQKQVWLHEKQAQQAAFEAAQLGKPCADVDQAARKCLESLGYGPDYAVPGLPHRTGHGVGLDIHEWPYMVRHDQTPLDVGMTFSNEPMLCLYGEFGVRLEDHIYMTENGPAWFSQPSHSIENPFGL